MRAAVISALATFFAAAIAAAVVFIQIGRQARKARENNRHLEEIKLKLAIYEKILVACRESALAEIELSNFIRMFLAAIQAAKIFQSNGYNFTVPSQRAPAFTQKSFDMHMKAVGIISAVEEWNIVDPRIVVFQHAINAAIFDASGAAQKYFNEFMTLFPVDMPGESGKQFPWTLPSDQIVESLTIHGETVLSRLSTLSAYVDDFRFQMQELLVGPLFPKHRINVRVPLDPDFKVIQLAQYKKLIKFFEEESAWGRNKIRIRDEVMKQYSA